MEWEFNWIDQNTHHYNSLEHVQCVKINIKNRYRRVAIIRRLRELKSSKRSW